MNYFRPSIQAIKARNDFIKITDEVTAYYPNVSRQAFVQMDVFEAFELIRHRKQKAEEEERRMKKQAGGSSDE